MARYFVRFRHSDTGLTPTFLIFKKASDLSVITPPSIAEVGGGTYYFDYSPVFDIVFEIDGGDSIPTEEVRYVSDTISPKDSYLDEPISQVKTDVWTDSVTYSAGQKGLRVDQLGDPANTSANSTLFGKVLLYKESVRGDSAGTSDGESNKSSQNHVMGGTGYGGTGVDVKTVKDTIGTPSDASSSATLFGKAIKYKELIRGDAAETNNGMSTVEVKTSIKGVDDADITQAWDGLSSDISGAVTTLGGADARNLTQVFNNVDSARDAIRGVDNRDNTQVYDKVAAVDLTVSGLETTINAARDSVKGADLRDLTQLAGSGFASTDSLKAIKTALDTLDPPDNASIATILEKVGYIGLPADISGAATLFGRIYATRDYIVGAGDFDLTDIAGTGFSTAANSLKVLTDGPIARILGMMHENSVLDLCTFDPESSNLTSARLRLYDTAAHAQSAKDASPADYLTGKVAQYSIVASYLLGSGNMVSYLVKLEWKAT